MPETRIFPTPDEALVIVETSLRRRLKSGEPYDAEALRAFVATKLGGVPSSKGVMPSSVRAWAREFLATRTSWCPANGRRVMKSGRPFGG